MGAYLLSARRGKGNWQPFLRVTDFSLADVEQLLEGVCRHLRRERPNAECMALPEHPEDPRRTMAVVHARVLLHDYHQKVQEFMKEPAEVMLDPTMRFVFADVLWLRPTQVYAEKFAAVIMQSKPEALGREVADTPVRKGPVGVSLLDVARVVNDGEERDARCKETLAPEQSPEVAEADRQIARAPANRSV